MFSHCNRRSITKEEQTHFLFLLFLLLLLLLLVVHKNLEKQNKSLNFAAKQEPKRPSFWCKTENTKKKKKKKLEFSTQKNEPKK